VSEKVAESGESALELRADGKKRAWSRTKVADFEAKSADFGTFLEVFSENA
jgi:hypothetical protein